MGATGALLAARLLHSLLSQPVASLDVVLPDAPAFLSCEGPGYSPAWRQLKLEIQRAASQTIPLNMLVASQGGDPGLLRAALDRVDVCIFHGTRFGETWSKAYFPMREAALRPDEGPGGFREFVESHGSGLWGGLLGEWLGGEAELIGSEPFCLSGCIAALWLVGTAEQDWGGGNAVFLLQLARIMLGVLAPWSSSKPYRWGDAFVPALGRWGGWLGKTYSRGSVSGFAIRRRWRLPSLGSQHCWRLQSVGGFSERSAVCCRRSEDVA
ncbi:unnamed protein product [Polarella glacialis]|uniref:Uncharacterized protein n=1 Tax=Polarella glacialis TaxID=89957 RepID=A0A813F531_POLGL|nr:unnamed protein product [Polarella glacialis]